MTKLKIMIVDVLIYIEEVEFIPATKEKSISDPAQEDFTPDRMEVIAAHTELTPINIEDLINYTQIPKSITKADLNKQPKIDVTLKGGVGMKLVGLVEDFEKDLLRQLKSAKSGRALHWLTYLSKKHGNKLEGSNSENVM